MISVFQTGADVELRMPAELEGLVPLFKMNPTMDVPEAKDIRSVLALNGGNCIGCD